MSCEFIVNFTQEPDNGSECGDKAVAQCGDCGIFACKDHSKGFAVCEKCRHMYCTACFEDHACAGGL